MTGFLCIAIFRVRAEISIFGEIYIPLVRPDIQALKQHGEEDEKKMEALDKEVKKLRDGL